MLKRRTIFNTDCRLDLKCPATSIESPLLHRPERPLRAALAVLALNLRGLVLVSWCDRLPGPPAPHWLPLTPCYHHLHVFILLKRWGIFEHVKWTHSFGVGVTVTVLRSLSNFADAFTPNFAQLTLRSCVLLLHVDYRFYLFLEFFQGLPLCTIFNLDFFIYVVKKYLQCFAKRSLVRFLWPLLTFTAVFWLLTKAGWLIGEPPWGVYISAVTQNC